MSLRIACSESLQKKLSHPVHPAENHATPLLDVWHATTFTAHNTEILLFTNQVAAFSLLVPAKKNMSFEELEATFKHALLEQVGEHKSLHDYQHFFEKKLKHGMTFTRDQESTLHWLVEGIQNLFTQDPEHTKDLAKACHRINNSEFPELDFKSPAHTLMFTLASMPHDDA